MSGLRGKVTFITGSEKNAGKTTFLNYVLARLRGARPVAYMTIGVDGEETDLVFGNPKPRITAVPGDIIASTDRLFSRSDGEFEYLDVFPFSTPLGRMCLARAMRPCHVEIAGPDTNEQLSVLIAAAESRGARTCLVDGAVNRVTQAASRGDAGFVFVASVRRQSFNSDMDAIRLMLDYDSVPRYDGKAGGFRVQGALTEARAAAIPKDAEAVVLEDFTKNFLSLQAWTRFRRQRRVEFEHVVPLRFVQAVLYDVSAEEIAPLVASGRVLPNIYEGASV